MKKVFLDIDDKILKQSFVDLLTTFGFEFVDKKKADFVLSDVDDKIIVNDKVFIKPVDFFSIIAELSNKTDLHFADMVLKVEKRQAIFGEKVAMLTDIETKILSILMSNCDGISSEDLSVAVFSKVNESCLKSLATHIYNLKKKLENITGKQKNIILENARYFLNF